jgi:hypothetical protein
MANQITHIALAKNAQKLISHSTDKDFMMGTVFPDIRYLGVIDRSKTHLHGTLEEVLKEKNNFLAGMKFHALVDHVREKYMIENGIYDFIPKSKLITQSLKCAEDVLYYEKVKNWPEIVSYFNEIKPEELEFGISKEDLARWHKILQNYFAVAPTNRTRAGLILGLGFSEDVVMEINALTNQILNDQNVVIVILEFWKHFDHLVRAYEKVH